ncbi:GyrI-like domain-containing protein [Gracilibacillus halophilus]|nr:effector binding domain-containing protein [Gracilibacillus halophilus]
MDIVTKESFTVIGMMVETSWEELFQEMPKTWKKMKDRVSELPHRRSYQMMDISLGQTNGIYTQLIAVEVSETDHVPNDMVVKQIPAQTYLHHSHKGSLIDISQTFGTMYQYAKEENLPADDMKLDIGYTVEGTETSHDLYIKLRYD